MRSPDAVVAAVRHALEAEPHLHWGYVFGSVARGAQFRDVDVALMPAATLPAGSVVWGQIIARLETAVTAKVDLVDVGQAGLPLVGPLLTERIVVLDRERDARIAWEVETTSRWLDFKPSYEEAERIRTLAMQARLRGTLMVDGEAIRRRLAQLQDALADLRRYRARFDATSLASDRDAQHMVLHALYVAAQSAIDLALHAAADSEQPSSGTYQQAFQRLATAGRIDRELATRMMGWAGLRNVLAHHYVDVDYARIAATLGNELPDLERFAAAAATWL